MGTSIPCELMTGNELMKEIKKEFIYPYDFLGELDYDLGICYGQNVTVKCYNTLGGVCADDFLTDKDGNKVSFGQFSVFLERFIALPNYYKLCLKLASKGLVVAEVSTFPMKV
jgi:hypothetical protein